MRSNALFLFPSLLLAVPLAAGAHPGHGPGEDLTHRELPGCVDPSSCERLSCAAGGSCAHLRPEDGELMRLARTALERGAASSAVRMIAPLASRDPAAALLLGWALEALGDPVGAALAFERATSL